MVEDSESRHPDSPGELAEPADEQRRPGHGRLGVLKSKPTKVTYIKSEVVSVLIAGSFRAVILDSCAS